MNQVPVFGTRIEGRAYVRRPSAYALVRNAEGKLAVVRTPHGCFLPGGGSDAHESPQQTAEREVREECGLAVRPRSLLARAVQFVYSLEELEYFEKICAFVEADVVGNAPSTEPDHELVWMSTDQAVRELSHESHRWAVRRLATVSTQQSAFSPETL